MTVLIRSRVIASILLVAAGTMLSGANCGQIPRASTQKNDLSTMRTVSLSIGSKATYTVYVADKGETQQIGLMNVSEADLPVDRGMLFVFADDSYRSFWMRNTIIPLDIAYIRSDGTIVKTYTMEALNEEGYPSIEPAMFALEVRSGQFAQHGIVMGDHVNIPPELFK
jgi:uncharacterized membrane protein (UPF0127 family)